MRNLKEEEIQVASRFLFLSMAIVVLGKDIRQIESGPFKIKEPYLELLRKMDHVAKNERRELRKKMAHDKIDVVFVQKNDTFSTYLFIANGYEEERRYFNPAVRKKVEHILYELMFSAMKKPTPPLSDAL
ncbi:hypothetical protein CEY16_00670 [Halalkalibacillus sediminis]|uniref:Uncharacterized protein n=1 Tax=Halalkalibacillus sediminis TaxID=2018042 RepID=A0A2I0QVF2_9BACI|nr:hypothetical protein [Halalkalibacillus sediminis]PKR78305.1 hypothetical protein CEY16_00670 [Halalkalibacillus sediminis]